VPGVVAGHTTRGAWGFSTGLADVQDLYVERLRHRDDGGVEYEFEGSWHPADVRREVIRVRRGGGRPAEVVETVVTTRHGPIINVLAPELTGEQPLALRWTGYEPSAMFRTLLDMNRARSCEQMRAALRGWHTPVQNVVYADVDGDIGHTYAGRVPIRARGDGRLPVPGWTGEYEWTGYVPYEDLPHQHNPPSGYIAAANNQVVGAAYPYWLGADFDTGNRAERIAELIGAAGTMDVATCRAMQLDQVSTSGRRTAAALWGLASPDPAVDEALRLMDGWDGQLGSDSPQAAIYAVFSATLARRLLRPRLGELTEPYTGHGVTPVLAESSILAERCREWLDATLLDPTSRWWDTADGQTREGHILAAMADTVATLTRRFGADPVRWRWGRLHTLTLRHMLGTRAPLDRLLNRGPYPMGGDRDTLWKAQIARHDPQTDGVMTGPPFRFIADLGNLGQSRGQLMPGQSGQVGSPHYADGIGSWLRGDHHPMLLDRAAVEGNAEARFVLVP
jgi:penicillin amidase